MAFGRKAKKPLSAKAKAKARAAKLAARQAAIEAGEIPAVQPKKSDPFKKKILASLGDKSVSEATDEFKKRAQLAEADLQEARAMEKAQQQQVDEAQGDYEKAQDLIAESTEKELKAAASYKDLVCQRSEVAKKVEECRKDLYEAQKKIAMLEVLSVNQAKMKALEETRKKAQEQAEEAKRTMLESRQREKEALEATRKALAQTRLDQKGIGKGVKRRAEDSLLKVHPDEADTIPATLLDGSQAADID